MEYIDLTKEIYHGHEQEYTPIMAPLSLTDSNTSLPTVWRTHHASITHAKPLPIPYPRKKNDKLENTIRTQMNDFMRYSLQQNYSDSEQNSSILTPYQTVTASIHKKVSIKRRNTNTNTNTNIHIHASKNPFSRRSSSDKFVKINNNASDENINLNLDPSRNAYLSNTTSIISKSYSVSNTNTSYRSSLHESRHKSDKNSKNFINLGDISMNIDKYENEIDFYKNRDNIIKQYVECGDKKKGTQNIIEIYLQRWHEEEMLNIPKIQYCFENGSHTPKKHRKLKKKKAKKNSPTVILSKKRRKKIGKKKASHSYDHIDKNLNPQKKRNYKGGNSKTLKIPALNTRFSENENDNERSQLLNSSVDRYSDGNASYIEKRFTFGSENIKKFVNIPCLKLDRNDHSLSYSMSQSVKTDKISNGSYVNSFYNKRVHEYIPQPRASIIEKTFTWSDYHGNDKQISKPFVY